MSSRFAKTLEQIKAQGNLRVIPNITVGEEHVVDFSTNDYLGLAARTDLREEFLHQASSHGWEMTSSASRLLSATQSSYGRLEQQLSSDYNGRAALLFNSGYHANSGIIPAICDTQTLIVADKLVHASIIDGIRLSGCEFERFRHNDISHLERILARHPNREVLLIVESVYSMDGDTAPLQALAELRRNRRDTMLYVDEAHAVGVKGPAGLGYCVEEECMDAIDVLVGTFGKALASVGAFCITSSELRSYLVNSSRSLIFSTAMPPISVEWSLAMWRAMKQMDSERSHLMKLAQMIAPESPSHIVPYIVGNAAHCISLSKHLLKRNLKVLPIRTPTVPPGTERLRISLSAAHTQADVKRLIEALKQLPAS